MPSPKSPKKLSPRYNLVVKLQSLGYQKIVGLDEVGRGALAGPLVVAAIELPKRIDGITDSKLLSAVTREKLATQIIKQASQLSYGHASPSEIDTFGLSAALKLAYQRALENIEADLFLTDYVRLPGRRYVTQIHGDHYLYPSAAASIVAKVYRDNLMRQLHQQFPQYGWDDNVGYGTAHHRQVISEQGLTLIHRRSFCRS